MYFQYLNWKSCWWVKQFQRILKIILLYYRNPSPWRHKSPIYSSTQTRSKAHTWRFSSVINKGRRDRVEQGLCTPTAVKPYRDLLIDWRPAEFIAERSIAVTIEAKNKFKTVVTLPICCVYEPQFWRATSFVTLACSSQVDAKVFFGLDVF